MAKKKIKKNILTFNAVFSEEDTGGYSVSVPALPGCFSQGEDFEEAAKNITEAIELYLEDEKDFKDWVDHKNKKEFLAPVQVHA
ncbi:MAG: type II toxin-antitoxin system HicB family antitoxin [bacterium]|nr:type II toxin-antitoxin system HicB family antitoxin [bacterium]